MTIYQNDGHVKHIDIQDKKMDLLNPDYQFLLQDETEITNADDIKKCGNYLTTDETIGLPVVVKYTSTQSFNLSPLKGSLKVMNVSDTYCQLYINRETGQIYFRYESTKGWTTWVNVMTEEAHSLGYVTPQYYLAKHAGQLLSDPWGMCLQEAFDSGLLVIIPPGTYAVSTPLEITNERTTVIGGGNVVIENKSGASSEVEHVLSIHGSYTRIDNVSFKYSGSNEAFHSVVQIGLLEGTDSGDGFNTELHNVAIRGNDKKGYGIWVGAAEVRLQNCKIRGAGESGIRVHAPDLNLYNCYCEQNGTYGLETRGNGSIDAYHVHSYKNGSHGFYLNGCDYSNFMECYADRNKGMGYYIVDCKRALTFENCWSFYSEGDYHIYCENVKQAIFTNCRLTKATNMVSAIRLKNSLVHISNTYLDASPAIVYSSNSLFLVDNCYGELEKYNRKYGEIYYSTTIPAGETYHVSVLTDIPSAWLKTDPDITNWKITTGWRQTDLNKYGIVSYTVGVPWEFTTSSHPIVIKSDKTDSDLIDLTACEVTAENDHLLVNMAFTNSASVEVQLGGYVKWNGNGRSISIKPQD